MLFKAFELYSLGRDMKKDPIGTGAGLGRDAVAPMFVIPVILLAIASLGMMALWWWIGWGIFIFFAIIAWLVLCAIHIAYRGLSRVFGVTEQAVKQRVSGFRSQHSATDPASANIRTSTIIDVEGRE